MKALNLHAIGDLRYEDLPKPTIKEDEVLVQIKNCGICGSDIGRVFTHGTYHFPTVIGHEFSGVVVKDDSGRWLGKKVAVFPLLPCFQCPSCKSGNYAQCISYDYYGSRRNGGFAEFLSVKKFNLVEIPDGVSFEEAAMCEPTAVAIHALRKCNPAQNSPLLISGAGTIGLIIGQLARSRTQSDVFFIENDQSKIDFLQKLGFSLWDGKQKFDYAIEGTGASSALQSMLSAMNAFGTMVLMGNPGKDVLLTQKAYWAILRSELSLKGMWNNCYNDAENDWKDAIRAISNGEVQLKQLITHVFSLAEGLKGLTLMRDKKEFYCKVMIDVEK